MAPPRAVVLVCGPPCAGKTTHVEQHRQPGDVVLDQDVIGAKAMNKALAALPAIAGTVWVIRCTPGPARRAALARRLGATRVELVVPPLDVLLHRARQRPDPRRTIAQVHGWLRQEQANPPPRTRATRPRAAATTTERGLGWAHQQERQRALARLQPGAPCPLCGHPMHPRQRLDLDHSVPRALGGRGPRRLAHARCNRQAGQRLGIALQQQRQRARTSQANSRRW